MKRNNIHYIQKMGENGCGYCPRNILQPGIIFQSTYCAVERKRRYRLKTKGRPVYISLSDSRTRRPESCCSSSQSCLPE